MTNSDLNCPGCGSKMIIEKGANMAFCSYCGNKVVIDISKPSFCKECGGKLDDNYVCKNCGSSMSTFKDENGNILDIEQFKSAILGIKKKILKNIKEYVDKQIDE